MAAITATSIPTMDATLIISLTRFAWFRLRARECCVRTPMALMLSGGASTPLTKPQTAERVWAEEAKRGEREREEQEQSVTGGELRVVNLEGVSLWTGGPFTGTNSSSS